MGFGQASSSLLPCCARKKGEWNWTAHVFDWECRLSIARRPSAGTNIHPHASCPWMCKRCWMTFPIGTWAAVRDLHCTECLATKAHR